MKTKQFHVSNFGSFGGGLATDTEGYVTIHDDPRYAVASDADLTRWVEDTSQPRAIRNAAQAEINERELNAWRNK